MSTCQCSVRFQRLSEAGAFFGDPRRRPGQEVGCLEDTVNAGRAARGDVGVKHHEGEPAVAFGGVLAGEGANAFLLVVGEPMIAWHPGIVFIGFAEAKFPVMELAGANIEPGQEAADGDLRLVAPAPDEIDKFVTGVMWHPAAF